MTMSGSEVRWSLACRDLGFVCEWELRARPLAELEGRFREHAVCAHAAASADPEWASKVAGARRPS